MLPLMSKLVISALLSTATLIDPTTPKALSFDASAFVTNTNKIRLSVLKSSEKPVTVTLRDSQHKVLYQQTLNKKETKQAFLFSVEDLTDGEYELEIASSEGSIRKQVKLSSAPVETTRVIAMQ
ncbi:hypothetical protein BN8_02278 [Fibrisoma limi BUZ 3]|uniref:Secretion system C-terminal sorting domain-containing protein n=1 Tax=Fibrisoma limi BUZ 3 TaxID=1185876 RepID=I2GH27_9BACT|nr:hypothetical protein [Fibrisoma limi]CCH53202.1 hypothetical protein BN8_02278 [Fibrisoma limi BUZ 3]